MPGAPGPRYASALFARREFSGDPRPIYRRDAAFFARAARVSAAPRAIGARAGLIEKSPGGGITRPGAAGIYARRSE